MGKHPVLKPREVTSILEKLGFAEVRQRGSHKQYRHADGRNTTVPFHSGRRPPRPRSSVKSPETSASPSKRCFNTGEGVKITLAQFGNSSV